MRRSELLSSFVQKNIALAPDILRSYVVDAHGNPLFHRWAYYRFRKIIDDFLSGRTEQRWVILSGLRGTGKTTLLAQLYFYLLEKRIPPTRVVYASLDEVTKLMGAGLREVVSEYEGILGSSIERLREPVFLLLDEAHYDGNWGITQKTIYDRTKKVFMMTTGSSALSLQTSSDTARRARSEKLLPLNFPEYVMLEHRTTQVKDLKSGIEKALFFSASADDARAKIELLKGDINLYWSTIKPFEVETFLAVGTLPFSLELDREEEVHKRVLGILSKVIYEDIPAFSPFERGTLEKIWNLLLLLSISEKVSYESMCSQLGLSRSTLSEVLSILTRSELIHPVKAYGSVARGVRKAPKYKFVAPAIKAALLWRAGKLSRTPEVFGRLLEDAVAAYLYRLRETGGWPEFYHDPAKGGADFVLAFADGSKVVLEVGYGDKGTDQIMKTAKKVGPKYSILVSDATKDVDSSGDVLFVPREVFLSM